MDCKRHVLSSGRCIVVRLKRSAKKNIIMRPVSTDEISINIPPYLSERRLAAWLSENENVVLDVLSRKPENEPEGRPAAVWYRGQRHGLQEHAAGFVVLAGNVFFLPQEDWLVQKRHLKHYLQQRAAETLLPRLYGHIAETGLQPAAVSLSGAKTFWGVCRTRTGIRLNWRLVGAPDYVSDYVCIHELCHLRHPNHSASFWAMVDTLTPHTAGAKAWLKENGRELFLLD